MGHFNFLFKALRTHQRQKTISSGDELADIFTLEQLRNLPNSGGEDTVRSSVDYILPIDTSLIGTIENLTLLGEEDLVGTGNKLDNYISGNLGNNWLYGGPGNDSLEGNAGNDIFLGNEGEDSFVYASESNFVNADFGLDIILDFVSGEDLIVLSADTFGLDSSSGKGLSSKDFVVVNSDNLVDTSSQRIVFSRSSSALFYNPNGSQTGFGIAPSSAAFLSFLGTEDLDATDFIVTEE